MSYAWGSSAFPAATFDGQVQIDNLGQLYQWSVASGVWIRCPELCLEELRSWSMYAYGMDINQDPFLRKRCLARDTWDVAFDKAFIVCEDIENPNVVYGRIAHVSMAELLAWLPTVVPHGASYDAHFRLRVLQPVDPRRRPDHVYGWNNMYGAFRGRAAYRSNKGRNDIGLPQSAGMDGKSASTFVTSPAPEIQLVQLFCGQTPATPETRAIWFPRSRQNLTQLPLNNGARVRPSYFDRMCWNTVSQTWNPITSEEWMTSDANMVNPACFVVGNDFHGMEVEALKNYTQGVRFITAHRTVCVVYHIHDLADATNHAFYVKPLGITSMAADIQVSHGDWDLMAVSIFEGDGGNARWVKVPNVQDRRPRAGWRWWIHDTLPRSSNNRSGQQHWSLGTQAIPREVKFYIRNNVTGVASPYFPGSVEVARRRYNMAIGFLEKRG